MRKFDAAFMVLPLLLVAGTARADQIVGIVQSIDAASGTVVVNSQPYHLESGVAGLKIGEIKAGDKVRLEYDVNTNAVYEADHAK